MTRLRYFLSKLKLHLNPAWRRSTKAIRAAERRHKRSRDLKAARTDLIHRALRGAS